MNLLENQIRLQYKIFAHENYWSQLHAQDPKTETMVARKLVKGAEEVVAWARTFNGRANLYIGRAARDEAGIPVRAGVFTLDVDPVRPKGTASSAEQHHKALWVGKTIVRTLGDGYLCSSGNGALVICPFDRPVTEGLLEFSARAKQLEASLRESYATEGINVDTTQDAARLTRLMGSVNVKGSREEWRVAHFVHKPVFRAVRSRVRDAIERIQVTYPIYQQMAGGRENPLETRTPEVRPGSLPTYDHSVYATREKAEFAFALRLKLAGMGPDDIRQQLALYGYIRNPRDAQRVIEKLFAGGGAFGGGSAVIQRGFNGSASSPVVPAPEPLWTPASGISATAGREAGSLAAAGIGTGFKFLDSKLGGFRPGAVYAIEAPTNVGKSTCITQIAAHLARCGRRVLLVITEMDVKEAVNRIRAISTGIPASVLDSGGLSGESRLALEVFERDFARCQLFIRYTTSPNQAAIEEDIKASNAEVVLWDYFQHFETGNESRQVQLGSLARWFESTALKYQIPFVVAAQLHRRVDFKTNKTLPSTMDNIKDCKVLNDAAKVVITLDWDTAADHGEDGPVPVVMDIAKNKGPMAKGIVRLVRNIPRFEDL